jgi:Tfp pilus assembly protein PilF
LLAAAELVEVSIVEQQEREAVQAARRLLAGESTVTPLIRWQAATVLRRTGLAEEIPDEFRFEDYGAASFWRRCTKEYQFDPIAWVELALAQTVAGHIEHAERSMKIALQLAPNNRHVLRSAARLWLRAGDRKRAHAIIANSPASKNDPWLIASEIALSTVADTKPILLKTGIAILERDQLLPRQITELAGAVATIEIIDGNRKKARKHFNQSMLDPNGNALAQAEWAQPQFGTNLLHESQLSAVEEPFEARAIHAFREGKFKQSIVASEQWAKIEPYSIRPFEFGSTAACITGDYMTVIALAEAGLRMRPGAPQLLNNLSFGLAALGMVDKAAQALNQIPKNVADVSKFVMHANQGLIALRRRDKVRAFLEYGIAIEGFNRMGNALLALSAKVYLAREAARAGYLEDAAAMVDALKDDVAKSLSKAEQHIWGVARNLVLAAQQYGQVALSRQ